MSKLWKRNMVAGAVLLLVCAAIFLNGRYAEKVEQTDKILGQATLVDGTEGEVSAVSGGAQPDDYFAAARLTREQARDSALSLLKEASGTAEVDEETASKAAQTMMIKSLAGQLAPFGITCNSIAPGVIYTDRNTEALSDPEYAKKVTDQIPARFYGEPRDCAGAAVLLCSDAGRYITGQSLYVDGGKSL